jgi:hypothetical protein
MGGEEVGSTLNQEKNGCRDRSSQNSNIGERCCYHDFELSVSLQNERIKTSFYELKTIPKKEKKKNQCILTPNLIYNSCSEREPISGRMEICNLERLHLQ